MSTQTKNGSPILVDSWDGLPRELSKVSPGNYLIDYLSDSSVLIKPLGNEELKELTCDSPKEHSSSEKDENISIQTKENFFADDEAEESKKYIESSRILIRVSLLPQLKLHLCSLGLFFFSFVFNGSLDNYPASLALQNALGYIFPYDLIMMILKGAFFIILFSYLHVYYNHRFYITKNSIECSKGIIARNDSKVSIKDIQSVGIRRPLINMLTNTGTLEFATSGTDQSEVTFINIYNPKKYRKVIADLGLEE